MQGQTVRIVSQAIRYIEEHLHEKMDLDMVASALHYSKYHLHRIFTKTVGLTIHDYAKRRQLTEAAKLLVFSAKPIIEIALMSGYENQQAFTDIFKAMYKTSPAEFRETENFYPLQLEIYLKEELIKMDLTKDNIKFATPEDADDWMELVSLTIDGYPCLDKGDYTANLHQYIADKKALILRDDDMAIGVMGFSQGTGSIDFLAVHPQYRHLGITKLFLDKLAGRIPPSWICRTGTACGIWLPGAAFRASTEKQGGNKE
jgi:AraC-like DNA-binding protein/GNAT superfamily N-acetyltransferase